MGAYVYGVVAERGGPSRAEGIDGRRVEVVDGDGLAALVSDAREPPVRANRRNLLAHARVLQQVAAERCVLPMQFGVVMPSRAAVRRDLLDAHREQLTAQLDAFEPYVELDLRALCPEDELLRAVLAERPDIRRLRDALAGSAPHARYHERIRLGELVAGARAALREAIERRVVAALEPLAAATDVGEAVHEQVVANVAFLVERARVGELDAAVDRLGRELGEAVRLRYVGPLAPHRFVEPAASPEAASWA